MSDLKADAISVSYPYADKGKRGRKQILEPLSLSMSKGESVVVVGPSGCGKSTLLNVLAGFQTPDHGSVSIDHRTLHGPGGNRSVVFQDDALMPWLNAWKNVALGLKFKGVSQQEQKAKAHEVLKWVGLSDFAEQRPTALSGGQRQRLGLARALAVEPDFLFLDEPFGALDALTRERMQGLLLTLWRKTRKGIFLITHSIDEALLLSTDLLVMAGPPGRIIRHLKPGFAERFIDGETPEALRRDPRFETLRQEVNALLHPREENHTAEANQHKGSETISSLSTPFEAADAPYNSTSEQGARHGSI